MESHPHEVLFVALIATFAIFHIAQAQDQEGFISLDCGLSPNEVSPYIEPITGLRFSSDAGFIQSGQIARVDKSLEATSLKSYMTLRYFPDGLRNCYNLSVNQGTTYLMRATALYGNYDGLKAFPKFDLYIGPNFWVTIDMQKYGDGQAEEIIHIPRSNSLDVCLVKTDTSTPIISLLEFRPLDNDTYITGLGSLKNFMRFYLSKSESIHRFPEDIKDRIWEPYFESEWTQISTTLKANNSDDGYFVPRNVLMTAAIPANASAPLSFTGELDSPNDELYLYLHFSEVQALRANESREFDILWSGDVVYEALRPEYLNITIIHSPPLTCEGGKCNLQLKRTKNSTLPPLLNAIEVYTVLKFPQLETNKNDVVAIKDIKATYELNRITWQGDPCVPRKFLWDGLDCNSTDTLTLPRITSL
ncbi:putative receptor-like protein kinase At3g46340 [Capsella rubella]|uniref:putative receptor-like protein kinase At3g46340 n=1 Tax=Capsella rubella TaxID=81985 RepID=UPI000CD53F2B|nr:putative receptor-like protein kinase At3g46340 [Capsella rubella]